jgi:hypothetical protein
MDNSQSAPDTIYDETKHEAPNWLPSIQQTRDQVKTMWQLPNQTISVTHQDNWDRKPIYTIRHTGFYSQIRLIFAAHEVPNPHVD